MRPTPVFGDPKADLVFQRIFGGDGHKTAVIGFLNDILQLDDTRRLTSVMLLPPGPGREDRERASVDMKCVEAVGSTHVSMEVFGAGFAYPTLDDVVGIRRVRLRPRADSELDDLISLVICDFEVWPRKDWAHVPMLSRWKEQGGVMGLPGHQFVFMELPKYAGGHDPQTFVDKWAHFFREAGNLLAVPEALRHPPLVDALAAC